MDKNKSMLIRGYTLAVCGIWRFFCGYTALSDYFCGFTVLAVFFVASRLRRASRYAACRHFFCGFTAFLQFIFRLHGYDNTVFSFSFSITVILLDKASFDPYYQLKRMVLCQNLIVALFFGFAVLGDFFCSFSASAPPITHPLNRIL